MWRFDDVDANPLRIEPNSNPQRSVNPNFGRLVVKRKGKEGIQPDEMANRILFRVVEFGAGSG
ncbi:MAG: hypothetical protein O7B24_14255, partial [Alphaproteobacteria bacterium]|nr:hypothetical protein [Alphaproteobacteria bacterium]